MATVQCIRSPDSEGEQLALLTGCRRLTFGEVLAGWRDAPALREATLSGLAATAAPAIFWEMPCLGIDALSRPYECMVLPAMGLNTIAPDACAFADKFAQERNAPIVVFDNLGGDAALVAPRPLGPTSDYGHLAAFVRAAPREQCHALLRAVADAALRLLETRPVWISTSGMGVAWLHVRLDERPKYYTCRRYRAACRAHRTPVMPRL